jgi:large subunit ribosomal protein L30
MADKADKQTTAKKSTGKSAVKSSAAKKTAAKKPATAKSTTKSDKRVTVTLVRSINGTRQSHRDTVRGLGLRRMHHTVELEDTPAVRGMINKVNYLLKVGA